MSDVAQTPDLQGLQDTRPPSERIRARSSRISDTLRSIIVFLCRFALQITKFLRNSIQNCIAFLGPTDPDALRKSRFGDQLAEYRTIFQLTLGASVVFASSYILLARVENTALSERSRVVISFLVAFCVYLVDLALVSKLQQLRAERETESFGLKTARSPGGWFRMPAILVLRVPLAVINAFVFSTVALTFLFSSDVDRVLLAQRTSENTNIEKRYRDQLTREISGLEARVTQAQEAVSRAKAEEQAALNAPPELVLSVQRTTDLDGPIESSLAEIDRLSTSRDRAKRERERQARLITCERTGSRDPEDLEAGCTGRASNPARRRDNTKENEARALRDEAKSEEDRLNRLIREEENRLAQLRAQRDAQLRAQAEAISSQASRYRQARLARINQANETLASNIQEENKAARLLNEKSVGAEAEIQSLMQNDPNYNKSLSDITSRIVALRQVESDNWYWFNGVKVLFILIELNAILTFMLVPLRRPSDVIDYVDFADMTRHHIHLAKLTEYRRPPANPQDYRDTFLNPKLEPQK